MLNLDVKSPFFYICKILPPGGAMPFVYLFLKNIPHKVDMTLIYLLIKYSHLSGSKYFSRCLNMKFALDYLLFEVKFYILKSFGYSNKRRR